MMGCLMLGAVNHWGLLGFSKLWVLDKRLRLQEPFWRSLAWWMDFYNLAKSGRVVLSPLAWAGVSDALSSQAEDGAELGSGSCDQSWRLPPWICWGLVNTEVIISRFPWSWNRVVSESGQQLSNLVRDSGVFCFCLSLCLCYIKPISLWSGCKRDAAVRGRQDDTP